MPTTAANSRQIIATKAVVIIVVGPRSMRDAGKERRLGLRTLMPAGRGAGQQGRRGRQRAGAHSTLAQSLALDINIKIKICWHLKTATVND